MILVGWNIISYFKIKQELVEEVNRKVKYIEDMIEKRSYSILHDSISVGLYNIGQSLFQSGNYIYSLDCIFKSLIAVKKGDNNKSKINACIEKLNQIIDTINKEGIDIKIKESSINDYMGSLDGLEAVNVNNIRKFILSL